MKAKLSPAALASIERCSELLETLEHAIMEFCQLTGRSEDETIDTFAEGMKVKLRMNKEQMQ